MKIISSRKLIIIKYLYIILPYKENRSGLKISDSYIFPPAEFKNHHTNYRLALVLEILLVKTTKKPILTYFRAPLDIKQQYLKSKYFVDLIENDFQITTCL